MGQLTYGRRLQKSPITGNLKVDVTFSVTKQAQWAPKENAKRVARVGEVHYSCSPMANLQGWHATCEGYLMLAGIQMQTTNAF